MFSSNTFLFAITAYIMGYIAAIPVGATQIEIAKRYINGYLFSAIMIVVGAVISDFMYGTIALFGIAPFLQNDNVKAIFSMINSIILVVLGMFTLRQAKDKMSGRLNTRDILPSKHIAFITGFLLAVTNPIMIYWWLLGSHLLMLLYGIQKFNTFYNFLMLIPGTLGIGSYPLTVLFGIHKTKKFFSPETIVKTTYIFSVALFVLAGYFIFDSASYFYRK